MKLKLLDQASSLTLAFISQLLKNTQEGEINMIDSSIVMENELQEVKEKYGLVIGSGNWDKEYEWLIDGWIPFNSIGFLGGPSASGKSFLVIEILGAIAFGRKAFGYLQVPKSKQGAVLYCAVEGLQGVAHRFEAWRVSRQIQEDVWNKKMFQFHKPFSFATVTPMQFVKNITTIEKVTGEKIRMIVVDTFINYAGISSENSSTEVQNAIQWMREVSLLGELSIMAIHHTGKSETAVGCDFNTLLRGSSDFGASAEFVLGVAQAKNEESKESMPFVWSAKLKDAEKQSPISAKIETFNLTLSNGNTQKIGVISQCQNIVISLPKAKSKSGTDTDSEFLESLVEANHGVVIEKSLKDEFRNYSEENYPHLSSDARRKRFERAFEKLKASIKDKHQI